MLSNTTNVLARRDLLRVLVSAELRASTAQRKLGWLWWLIDPLLMMLIYWGIVVGLFGRGRAEYDPYWVFIFFGLLAWKQISQCLSKATDSLRSHRSLIRAVPFPTVILPLASLFSSFVHFLAGFGVLGVMATLAPSPLHSGSLLPLLQLPLLFLLHITVLAGLVMVVACYGLIFRDLSGLMPHLLRIGFYFSPALFGPDLVEATLSQRMPQPLAELAYGLFMLNPFALVMTGYRASVFYGQFLPMANWGVLVAEAAISLVIGYRVYQHHDRRVIKFL